MQAKLRILVDMDNTILDLTGRVEQLWRQKYIEEPPEKITQWRFDEDYEALYPGAGSKVRDIYQGEGCIEGAKPIEGAIEALKKMVDEGHDVFICTAPFGVYTYCVHEKYKWLEKNLGKDWTKRIILTPDKTFVAADVIIDDKPEITGCQSPPMWKHILFTRSYNVTIDKPRITNWKDWKQEISKLCVPK
jgi:5'-nucleotidase